MNLRKYFSVIRQALRGEERDYTKGSIPEAVVLLAIPMILELSLESVFAVVDMYFVSKLGKNAIATVGLTESFITIVYSVGIGLSTAATALVARRVGEKNPEGASHAGAQTIVLGFLASLILSVLGVIYAPHVLKLMGASQQVVDEGTPFAQIMLGGSVVIVLLFLINGVFRGAGDAAMAMKSLWLASATNIVLCPILIHFFGLKGAAIATVIGRGTGVGYQCYHLWRGSGLLKMKKSYFYFDGPVARSLTKIASPAGLQFLIGSGSWIVLTRLIAETGGTDVSAGYQIAVRNFIFFILPAWGISNAAATLVGQNLGAKQYERAEESVYVTAKYSAILMAMVTVFLMTCAGPIIGVFSHEPAVNEFGVEALRIISAGFIFYGLGMVFTQAFNGAGDTSTPTWISFFSFWMFETPLAYFLVLYCGLGPMGAVYSLPASNLMLTVSSWLIFKRGKWKTIAV